MIATAISSKNSAIGNRQFLAKVPDGDGARWSEVSRHGQERRSWGTNRSDSPVGKQDVKPEPGGSVNRTVKNAIAFGESPGPRMAGRAKRNF